MLFVSCLCGVCALSVCSSESSPFSDIVSLAMVNAALASACDDDVDTVFCVTDL